jgi:hypothetical protein
MINKIDKKIKKINVIWVFQTGRLPLPYGPNLWNIFPTVNTFS